MNISDINKFALIAWGTKKEKQVFFSDNIQSNNDAINNLLLDIQTPIGISSINQVFYSFEYFENVISFTIYRSINDWFGKESFYAISVLANKEIKVPLSHMPEILNNLSNLYYEKYIAYNSKEQQVKNNAIENKQPFVDLLEKHTQNKTASFINIKSPPTNKKLHSKYKDDKELINIFENIGRQELKVVKQLILMPVNIKGVVCAYPEIKLEPIIMAPFIIKISDNKHEIIVNIDINVTYNGKQELISVSYGEYKLKNNIAFDNFVIIEVDNGTYKYFKKDFRIKEIYNKQTKQAIAEVVLEKQIYTLNKNLKDSIIAVSNSGSLTETRKKFLQEEAQENNFPYKILLKLAEEAIEKRRIEIESNKQSKTSMKNNDTNKKANFFNNYKKNAKYIIGIFAVIGLIIIAIVFYSLKNNYNYKALNDRCREIKNTVVSAKTYASCKRNYYAAQDSLTKINKEVDSLLKAKIIDSDSIIFIEKYTDIINKVYKNELSKEINKHVQSINFDLKKTEELIAEAKSHILKTVKLNVFKDICIQVKKADSVFRTKGIYKGKIKTIETELEKIKKWKISEKQKIEIDYYIRVLKAVNSYGKKMDRTTFSKFWKIYLDKKKFPNDISDFLIRQKYLNSSGEIIKLDKNGRIIKKK